ncbi:MAG: pyridoxamine 5'-phosphate oxidase family protein [Halobacteriales archaeon]
MQQYEYTFTVGLDRAAIDERLAAAETGVLSLARDDEAYAVPVAYHWDGEAFVFRLGDHAGSEKMAFIESTDRAAFLVSHYGPSDASWSVLATGSLERVPEDEAELLERQEDFIPLRIFGEEVESLTPVLYALDVERLTGRTT